MAQPALHFAIGATCTTVLTLAAGPARRRWYRLGPILAMLGGVWACLPDVNHLLRGVNWTLAEKVLEVEQKHTRNLWLNIFFFHQWLDRNYSGRGTILGIIWIVALLGTFFWLSARRIAKLENQLSIREGSRADRPGKTG